MHCLPVPVISCFVSACIVIIWYGVYAKLCMLWSYIIVEIDVECGLVSIIFCPVLSAFDWTKNVLGSHQLASFFIRNMQLW